MKDFTGWRDHLAQCDIFCGVVEGCFREAASQADMPSGYAGIVYLAAAKRDKVHGFR